MLYLAKPDEPERLGQIELTRPVSVSGLVKDTEGRPVANAWVWAATRIADQPTTSNSYRFLGYAQGRKYLAAQTGPDGAFRIDGFPTSATVDLTAHKPGLVLPQLTAYAYAYRAGQSGITLNLVPAAVIEGRYEFKGLAHGRPYRLSASCPGFGPGKLKIDAPEKAVQRVEAPPLVLPAADQILAGVVLDNQEQPVKYARVYFHGENQYEGHGQTDLNGRFLFRKVCPGRVQLSASDYGRKQGSITAEAGDTNVILHIQSPSTNAPAP